MATVSKKQSKKKVVKPGLKARIPQLLVWLGSGLVSIVVVCYITSAQLAAQAQTLSSYGHFDQAQQQLSLAQQFFPLLPRAGQFQHLAALKQSAKDYSDGVEMFHQDRWQSAEKSFAKVLPDDLNYLNAQEYVHQSQQVINSTGSFVDNKQRIIEAQSFMDQHQYPQVLTLLTDILSTDPNFALANKMRTEATQALAANPASENFTDNRKLHVPILMYHYISKPPSATDKIRVDLSVTPEVFNDQMSYLANHQYHPITLDQMYRALLGQETLPPNPIVLTFDDGYEDFYQNAYPILLKHHFQATIYVITNFTDNNPSYITWSQIKTMVASGFISVGSHTLDHPNLSAMTDLKLTQELNQSKAILEAKLGRPITSFCYPYGTYDARVVAAVKQAGYIGATTTEPGTWHTSQDLLTLTRMRIKNYPMQDYLK